MLIIADIFEVVFKGIMPYLAPVVLLLGAVTVADDLGDLIKKSFGSGQKRRSG